MKLPRIALRRMNASEFKRYVKAAIPEYADAHITIADSGAPVGMLWFDLKHRHGKIKSFIFDFRLDEAFRGKGLTRA
jgi:hypothetical protein